MKNLCLSVLLIAFNNTTAALPGKKISELTRQNFTGRLLSPTEKEFISPNIVLEKILAKHGYAPEDISDGSQITFLKAIRRPEVSFEKIFAHTIHHQELVPIHKEIFLTTFDVDDITMRENVFNTFLQNNQNRINSNNYFSEQIDFLTKKIPPIRIGISFMEVVLKKPPRTQETIRSFFRTLREEHGIHPEHIIVHPGLSFSRSDPHTLKNIAEEIFMKFLSEPVEVNDGIIPSTVFPDKKAVGIFTAKIWPRLNSSNKPKTDEHLMAQIKSTIQQLTGRSYRAENSDPQGQFLQAMTIAAQRNPNFNKFFYDTVDGLP